MKRELMGDPNPKLVTLVRRELAREAESGFARLTRIPQTDVIWFLDHFEGLCTSERESLLDALANWGAKVLSPHLAGAPTIAPALAQMRTARTQPGAKGGTRYTDIKTLAADRSFWDPNAYDSAWRERFSPRHFQPRPDLLPAMGDLKAAKAPLLRRLTDATLTESVGLKREKIAGGSRYSGSINGYDITVRLDFGSMLGQLCYSVTVTRAGERVLIPQISYETFWDVVRGWDYLTEENAARSVSFLADQLRYLVRFGEELDQASIMPS